MQVWVGKVSSIRLGVCVAGGVSNMVFTNLIRTAGLRHLRRSCAEKIDLLPLSIVFTCFFYSFLLARVLCDLCVGVSLHGVVAEHVAEALCGFSEAMSETLRTH